MSRWPGRIALMICIGMVVLIIGGSGAIGQGLFDLPFAQQTTGSPSGTRSASPSPTEECDLDPLPPPVCPEPEPSESGSPSPSPTNTADPGGEPQRHGSRISIRFNEDRSVFKGAVRSVARCERARNVVLRRVRDGRDPVVGKDVTSRTGKWKIRLPGADGRFYAKALKKTIAQGDAVCRPARSKTIRARSAP